MCAAIVSSAGASKIMVVTPADQDDSLRAASMYVGTHSRDGFQSTGVVDGLQETQPQLPHTGDAAESSNIKDELQESETLMRTIPTEDIYRNELPAYSLLLYKPGHGSSMEHSPLILTTNNDSAGVPILAEIFTSQSLPQSQVLVTTSAAIVSATPGSFTSSSQNVDPAWLQVVCNILSTSSSDGNKQVLSSRAVSETPPLPVGSISVPYPGFTTTTEDIALKETGPVNMEGAVKIPLTDIANKLTRQHNQAPAHAPRGELVILPPVSSHLEGRSHPEYLQALVNKSLHDCKRKPSLTSGGKENQVTNLHETKVTPGPAIRHGLGTGKLSKVNMSLLANSPLLCHEGSGGPIRESHNMKERRRRARIKDACNLMRQLVPGMSHKTDKATVFEFSARYIHFLKSFVGSNNDKDFLVKYNPY